MTCLLLWAFQAPSLRSPVTLPCFQSLNMDLQLLQINFGINVSLLFFQGSVQFLTSQEHSTDIYALNKNFSFKV